MQRLRDLGARRIIQMPGMGIWTMPGYAFHFTCSMGLNVAESANMFLEVMGWTFEKLWQVSSSTLAQTHTLHTQTHPSNAEFCADTPSTHTHRHHFTTASTRTHAAQLWLHESVWGASCLE